MMPKIDIRLVLDTRSAREKALHLIASATSAETICVNPLPPATAPSVDVPDRIFDAKRDK